jgi:Cu/Zn superoxide dismutase
VKRRLLVGVLLLGLLSAIPLSRAGAATQAIRSTSNVTLISDLDAAVGTSTLTRTASGISFTLQTSGLEPGHAVTIWWMVVNPADGGVAVLYAAGHVIDQDGTAEFGGYLQVGDSDGYAMGTDTSLEDALNATVYLVVRDHGPAKPGLVNQQIHTFGVCNPTCTDLQISEHQPS